MNEHMVRSALGSTSGGAGSPNGLTEGVSCVFRSTPIFRSAPPQLRVRSAAPPKGAPRAGAFNRILAKIRDFGRILSAPTEA